MLRFICCRTMRLCIDERSEIYCHMPTGSLLFFISLFRVIRKGTVVLFLTTAELLMLFEASINLPSFGVGIIHGNQYQIFFRDSS